MANSLLPRFKGLAKVLSTLILIPLFATSSFGQAQTDYSDMDNWYFHPEQTFNFLGFFDLDIAVIDKSLNIDSVIEIENKALTNTGIDVFFVHPTILETYPNVPDTVSISDQNAFQISGTILAQGGLLAKYGKLYAPKYRQASPPCFRGFYSEESRAEYLSIAYSDIKNAFLDYLENHNDGNRFIIAGHSQGSFLLGLLLRDVIDNAPEIREKMVTAILGGMGFVYATPSEFKGGWWENIPLCTTTNECGCIHNWRTFKEDQVQMETNTGLPEFNQVLIDEGLVYRSPDLETDWFVQDSLFYNSEPGPLRYYIAPDASYQLAEGYNFIAFDSLYTARFKRSSNLALSLSIEYTNDPNDMRPNDLLPEENHPNYSYWGFHNKDYHVYLWALMQQIDEKLIECATVTSVKNVVRDSNDLILYPNPGSDYLQFANMENLKQYEIVNAMGQMVAKGNLSASSNRIAIAALQKGSYVLKVLDNENQLWITKFVKQ